MSRRADESPDVDRAHIRMSPGLVEVSFSVTSISFVANNCLVVRQMVVTADLYCQSIYGIARSRETDLVASTSSAKTRRFLKTSN